MHFDNFKLKLNYGNHKYLRWTLILLLLRNPRLHIVHRCTGFSFPRSPLKSLADWNPCDDTLEWLGKEETCKLLEAIEGEFGCDFFELRDLLIFVVLEDVIVCEKFPGILKCLINIHYHCLKMKVCCSSLEKLKLILKILS